MPPAVLSGVSGLKKQPACQSGFGEMASALVEAAKGLAELARRDGQFVAGAGRRTNGQRRTRRTRILNERSVHTSAGLLTIGLANGEYEFLIPATSRGCAVYCMRRDFC